MISTISRCARTPRWQLAAANPIWVRPFTAKAPCFDGFDEKPPKQPNERSNEQPNQQPNQPSTATMGVPVFRRIMLPLDPGGRIASRDVIACIREEEMEEILLGRTRYLYRKFFFNEAARYVWLYVRRPVGKLSYVAEIGGCKLVPQELEMLPYYEKKRMEDLSEAGASSEIGTINREAGEGTVGGSIGALPRITYNGDLKRFDLPGLPRYAFLIRHLWEIMWPTHGVTCEEMWERGFLRSPPPPKYINARDHMLSYLPLSKQRMLF